MFGLTPLAQCLFSNSLRPIARMFLSQWHDKAWNGLSHTVKTGEPGFDHEFGKPSFEWFEDNPVERSVLDQGQASKAVGFANAVIKTYDFSDVKSICDIGGGQGAFLIQLLSVYPKIRGYVADLPGAVGSAKKAIAKANLGDRCKAIPYDFNKEAPPICDAYFLGFKYILLIDGREKNSNGIHYRADTYQRGPIDLLRNEPGLNIRSAMNITL